MGSVLDIGKSIIGIGGALKDIGAKKPNPYEGYPNKPFTKPFSTPAYRFGGGNLTRTDTGPNGLLGRERGIFDSLSALNPELAALIAQSAQSGQALGGLRAQAGGLSGTTQGLLGRTQGIEGELAGLQGEVRPGFGRLTESAVKTIRERGAETLGNLREQVTRRGVAGASFANDQESRLRQEITDQEEQARSQALIQEITLSTDIASRRLAANQLAGDLVKLDASNIALQGQLIAQQMGVTQQQAALIGQKLQVVQTQMQALRDQAARELQELGIASDFLSKVDQVLEANATDQIGGILNDAAGSASPGSAGYGTNGPDLTEAPWISDYSWGNTNNWFGGGVNYGGPSPVASATPNSFSSFYQ